MASEEIDHEDTSLGGITWHSSEPDSGPDVGISVYLGPDDRLWAGEVSNKLYEESGSPFDSDSGWFLIRYFQGTSTLIAKFADDMEARAFIEQVAVWVRELSFPTMAKTLAEAQLMPQNCAGTAVGRRAADLNFCISKAVPAGP